MDDRVNWAAHCAEAARGRGDFLTDANTDGGMAQERVAHIAGPGMPDALYEVHHRRWILPLLVVHDQSEWLLETSVGVFRPPLWPDRCPLSQPRIGVIPH